MLERRVAEGKPTPAMDNRPELYEDLQDVWLAFSELNQGRSYGFGPNPISMRDIQAWLAMSDITDADEKMDFLYLIRAMDVAWLKWFAKSQEARRK